MSDSLTEDQLKQMLQQQLGAGIAELTIVQRGGSSHDQGRITESYKVHEHGEKIESLNKEIQKKDDEIAALQNALQELREKNDELNSALKSKDVEIERLTARIDELEEEKRELQRKLASVEFEGSRKTGKGEDKPGASLVKTKPEFGTSMEIFRDGEK